MVHLFSLALLFAFTAVTSAAAQDKWTNAQRLARGLSPLRPQFGRTLPGYARNPTRVSGKRSSPSPSPLPSQTYSGRIQVVSYDGEPLGYLRNWATGSVNGVNFDGPDTELHVNFAVSYSGKGLVNIFATNPAFPSPYYIGTTTNATLAPGLPTAVQFGNVEKTPSLSPPVLYGDQAYESAIWTYNSTTNEIQVHYVNPDGSTSNTTIAYNIWNNSIFFVGDIEAFNNAVTDPDYLVSPVTFYFATL